MPTTQLDRIRNGDFRVGKIKPTAWRWDVLAGSPSCRLIPQGRNGDGRSLVLENRGRQDRSAFSQSFRCRSEHDYRIEILASCRAGDRESALGLILRARCFRKDQLLKDSAVESRPWRSDNPAWWRVCVKTPAQATRLEVALSIEGRETVADVHRVRAIPMDYVACEAHPVSMPPWPFFYPRPRQARTVLIVDGLERAASLKRVLAAHYSRRSIGISQPAELSRGGANADALVFSTNVSLPQWVTYAKLVQWSESRIVVLSLPVFQRVVNRLSDGCVTLREHVQADDTLGARVDFANYITNGFALRDVFDFSIHDPVSGAFRQPQMIRSARLREFMKAQALETILSSDTNMDASTGRPLCLARTTDRGALVVLDCDPLMAPPTVDGESDPACQILLNALGADTVSIGQYAAPATTRGTQAEHLRSFGLHVPGVTVEWESREQGKHSTAATGATPICRVGTEGGAAPVFAKPVIGVRTGLDSSGKHGIGGAQVWFKGLVRGEPCPARYAPLMRSLRDVVWLPLAGELTAAQTHRILATPVGGLLIDVWPNERNCLRVIVPGKGSDYAPYLDTLGQLDEQMRLGRCVGYMPKAGGRLGDRDAYAWRADEAPLEVRVDRSAFQDVLAPMLDAFRRVRIEVPASSTPTSTQSIGDSERLGLLLEWIAGLEIGGVVVNRDPRPRKIRWMPGGSPAGSSGKSSVKKPTVPTPCVLDAKGEARALTEAECKRLFTTGFSLPPAATLLLSPPQSPLAETRPAG